MAKVPNFDNYQCGLVINCGTVFKLFDKKSATHTRTGIIYENQQLKKELHKPIIRKFKKCKVGLFFKDDIWGADLANIDLLK